MTLRSVWLLLVLHVWHVLHVSAEEQECNVDFMVGTELLGRMVVVTDTCAALNKEGKALVNDLKNYFTQHPKEMEPYVSNSDKFSSLPFTPVVLQLPLKGGRFLTLKDLWFVERFLRRWMEQLPALWIDPEETLSKTSTQSLVFQTTLPIAEKLYRMINRELVSVSLSARHHRRRKSESDHFTSSGSLLSPSSGVSKSLGGSQAEQLLVLPQALTDTKSPRSQSPTRPATISAPSSLSLTSSRSLISSQSRSGGTCAVQFVADGQLLAVVFLQLSKGDCSQFDSAETFKSQISLFFPTQENTPQGVVTGADFQPLAVELHVTPKGGDMLRVTLKDRILIVIFLARALTKDWKLVKVNKNTLRLESDLGQVISSVQKTVRQQRIPDDRLEFDFKTLRDKLWFKHVALVIDGNSFMVSALLKVTNHKTNDFWNYKPVNLIYQDEQYHKFDVGVEKWNELKFFFEGFAYLKIGDVFYIKLASAASLTSTIKDLLVVESPGFPAIKHLLVIGTV